MCDFIERHSCQDPTPFACPIERKCLSNTDVCDGKYDCDIRHETNDTFNFVVPVIKSDEDHDMCSRKDEKSDFMYY